jgi:hypothetical protein
MTASASPVDNLEKAIARLRQVSDSVGKDTFAARALNAVARIVAEGEEQYLVAAAGAPSDYDVLLQILERPEALAVLNAGPLAAAKLRGLRIRERLLNVEGGTISSSEAASLLGISRQAVDKRRRANQLLGLSIGRRGYAYPVWQFDSRAGTLPGLVDVLAELKDHDPWIQAAFMLNPNARLDGSLPLDALRQGDTESAKRAARAYGEHGAA